MLTSKKFIQVVTIAGILLSSCKASHNESETDGYLGGTANGFVYTPGGAAGSRIGEHANFGARERHLDRDGWYGSSASSGCLVFGPYVPVTKANTRITATIHTSAFQCLGGAGHKCAHNYYGSMGPKDKPGKAGKYVIDIALNGQSLSSKTIEAQNWYEEVTVLNATVNQGRFEVRVCQLEGGNYQEYAGERCTRPIPDRSFALRNGTDECHDRHETRGNSLVVGVHNIRISGSHP